MMSTKTAHCDDLIKIGQLKKPYGIKGWLWVFSDTEDRAAIFDMQPWWMKTATGFQPLTVTKWRHQGSGLVASFEQVPDRNVAETMNGTTIWVDKSALPAPEDDEYYWSDLIGLAVINEQDERLGVIEQMLDNGAHDLMQLHADDDSIDDEARLIPWHKQTVLSVDLESDRVIVAWPSDY